MDVLCIHDDETLSMEFENALSSLGFEVECVTEKDGKSVEKHMKKNPAILLLPAKWREYAKKTHAVTVFIDDEETPDSLTLTEDWEEFKQKFMKIVLAHESRLKELLSRDKIRRNIIYSYGFAWGRTFIVDVSQSRKVRKILPNLCFEGMNFFIAVRERPEDFKNMKNAKVIWVTDIVGKDRIKPHNLTILTDSIIRYIEEHENAIILMDCIEYLLLYNDFVNILRNIELINSYVMEHSALMIIIIDSKAYTTKEYSLLSRYALEWKGE